MRPRHIIRGGAFVLLLLLFALAAGACSPVTQPPDTTENTATAEGVVEEPPEATDEPSPDMEEVEGVEVPYLEAWQGSGHADAEAEAFTHWDEEGEVPATCAACHSTPGYLDYLGEDGSELGVVDNPHETGTVIECGTCHNSTAGTLESVVFPSGAVGTDLDDSGRCMVCHQGRASVVQVNAAVADLQDLDTPNAELSFINIHYYAAAATLFGSEVSGGYEYEGQVYDPRFNHVEAYNTCAECHDPHSLELVVDDCATCHEGVEDVEDLRDVRMPSSAVDYDGDGDVVEGLYYEIETLQEDLMQEIQTYAAEVVGTPIVYNVAQHPYWFVDADADGEPTDADSERYEAFTGRLLKAAYNYQVALKDPGQYAHNAKYTIQLLHDSIADLRGELGQAGSLEAYVRDDPGHFLPSQEAFRHWDEDGIVPADCTKCHTAEGLPFYIEHGFTNGFEPSDSLSCLTCHSSYEDFALTAVSEVEFPSGAVLGFGEVAPSNLCLECHQGRESTVSLNAAIERAGVGDDQVGESLSFINPHYFAAGATLFGGNAAGAYQYEGQDYFGSLVHVENFNECSECHNAHTLEIRVDDCSTCHTPGIESEEDLRDIRFATGEAIDYDGDGNTEEGIALEIETMHDDLLAAIYDYSQNTVNAPIVFGLSYPYWFNDTNGNQELDEDEAAVPNRYASWTPKMLRAAYNYQYVEKDPGAFAHNPDYIMQALYDSLQDIGGQAAVNGMIRPPTPAGQ